MKHQKKYQKWCYHFLTALSVLVLLGVLVSCGSVDTTTSTNPAVSQPTGAQPNDSQAGNSSTSHIGHNNYGDEDYRHLIAKTNVQDLLNSTDTTALNITPQSQTPVSYNPPLKPMFTGSSRVGMKLLIISAEGGAADPTLDGITYFAKEIGIPYDVLIASTQTLTEASLLNANGDGKYQGIITTNVGLVNSTTFTSEFNDTEWNLLWQYAREFNVRQIAMSGFPGTIPEDYGLRTITQSGAERTALVTSQGAAIFSSLKSGVQIPIKNSFTYEASLCGAACPGITTTPILTNQANGNVLGAVTTTADGREILSLTMNHISFLRHTGLMAYDLLSWVTQGIFIGERRMYFTIDIDDWYLQSAVWNPATQSNFPTEGAGAVTFQISATDAYEARDSILNLRSRFGTTASTFNYNQVFNAAQADPNATVSCANNATLSQATLCVKDFFPWVSHTFTHAEMDFLNFGESRAEFANNINFAETRLPFDRQFLVTGKHSGLGWYRIADAPAGAQCVADQVPGDPFCQFGLQAANLSMVDAALDLGIKYMAANRGWFTHVAECDSCLLTHPLNSIIKLVPRWPTNIFFNTTNPTENASEFNYLYGPNGIVKDANGNPFFATTQSWDQIIDFEADITLRHILSASPYPHFMHQANLREYTNGRSLAYDYSEAVLQEYSQYFDLPLLSQNWADLTSTLEKRTSFFKSGASGVINKLDNSVTISSANGGTVFVTGVQLANANSFNYGGKVVSELQFSTGGSTIVNPVNSIAPINPVDVGGELLANPGFNTNTAWSNCGNAANSNISNGVLTLSGSGGCVFQTVPAVANKTYSLVCDSATGPNYSTVTLSMLNASWAPIDTSTVVVDNGVAQPSVQTSLTSTTSAAHVAVSFYSDGSATHESCSLTNDGSVIVDPVTPVDPTQGEQLANPGFNTNTDWLNCGNTANSNIANGVLTLAGSAGCVYQTVPAVANKTYTLVCDSATGPNYSTVKLSMLNSSWAQISESIVVVDNGVAQPSVVTNLNSTGNTAHVAVSFYSDGSATHESCSLTLN